MLRWDLVERKRGTMNVLGSDVRDRVEMEGTMFRKHGVRDKKLRTCSSYLNHGWDSEMARTSRGRIV